ncbi:nuclear transport factor 2 family protein [Pseudonocardia spinosispora]|uniref:nuclear transport factor 2 family protein n=1 Tax=Pseudonocardia spinosispora TaxID=103441 RepID=UPI000424DDA8|nr:nuclear transport factor 2 family protein [Pseudonocardia spinosispora]
MPLSADDKIAIQELSNTHVRHLDAHDVDAWAGCWLPDGAFIATYGAFTGHEAIKEFIRGHIAEGKEDGARHILSNYVIEGDGDRATVYSLVVKLQVEQAPHIIASGVYNDVVVRTPGGWRFESRRLDVDNGVFAAAAQ